jgi:hypothetical protein
MDDDQVEVTIVVKVGRGEASRVMRRIEIAARTCILAHLDEPAVLPLLEQQCRLRHW